jgi:hypothetical protein
MAWISVQIIATLRVDYQRLGPIFYDIQNVRANAVRDLA